MKKIFMTMMAAMLLCVSANAQGTKHEISIGYGGGSTSQIFDAYSKIGTALGSFGTVTADNHVEIGPISAEYFYRINDLIGVGVIGAYVITTEDAKRRGEDYGDFTDTYITVMPAVKINWLRKKNFGLYSKLAAGVTFAKEKAEYKDSDKTETDKDVLFNFHASALGIEVGNKVCGFAELGFGEQGIIMGGVRCKF
ncbi:MAG: hypothetical protein II612_02950 [Prevotella sp.]|nr:hypothetical protein [Prevotella sp.]